MSKTGEPQSNEIINKSDNFECISTDFGLIGICLQNADKI